MSRFPLRPGTSRAEIRVSVSPARPLELPPMSGRHILFRVMQAADRCVCERAASKPEGRAHPLHRDFACGRRGRGNGVGVADEPFQPEHGIVIVDVGVRSSGLCRTPGLARVRYLRNEALRRYRTRDRKSTRLNSSHANISYAVFCLKKKNKTIS